MAKRMLRPTISDTTTFAAWTSMVSRIADTVGTISERGGLRKRVNKKGGFRMRAYHGSQKLKDEFIGLLQWHQEQDKIIQGEYWDGERGCAIGCSLQSLAVITGRPLSHQDHVLYEELIGVPRVLARLEDGIFEGLSPADSKFWPAAFAAAIPVGADLSLVWPRFAIWLLAGPIEGVICFAKTDAQRKTILAVADAYGLVLEGNPPSTSEWRALAAAAAYYAAAAAINHDAHKRQAAKLIELLSSAEV
jgi:hypothetical protein